MKRMNLKYPFALPKASVLLIALVLVTSLGCMQEGQDIPANITLDQKSVYWYNTSSFNEDNFSDGTLHPYYVCTTQNPNYVQPFTKNGEQCIKFYWTQEGFDGTRMDKGAEACSNLDFYEEGYYGFSLYVPSSGYPYNKTTTVAQIFAENGCSSWAAMLEIRNNDLYISHRPACVSPTVAQVASNIPRDTWIPIIIRFKPSHTNHGAVEVWYGNACSTGTPTYSNKNINFAWGQWIGSSDVLDSSVGDNMIKLKFGMYCHDSANYTTGESRVVYFDNVSMRKGSDGWDDVNPLQ